MIAKKCEVCGKEIIVKASEISRGKGKTCSHECAGKMNKRKNGLGDKNSNWKGGRTDYDRIKKQRAEHPDRCSARKKVHNAIKSGKIERRACAFCGDTETQAHHEDYSKPLEVIFLCEKHHRQIHAK